MEFVSLRTIIYDLLNIIRGGKVTNDEIISERQIEFWIHEYRSKIIKQDLDKGKYSNPDYIQEFINSNGTPLHIVPYTQETRTVYRTELPIPKTIDLNYKSGITFIGDVEDNQIQLVPESRVNFQQYKKFTSNNTLAYLKDRYIYLHNPNDLQYLKVRGIFEVPTEIPGMTLDSKYPIPIDKLDVLKKMILAQELGIEYSAPNDEKNDANQTLESDIKGFKQTYKTNRSI